MGGGTLFDTSPHRAMSGLVDDLLFVEVSSESEASTWEDSDVEQFIVPANSGDQMGIDDALILMGRLNLDDGSNSVDGGLFYLVRWQRPLGGLFYLGGGVSYLGGPFYLGGF